MIEKSLSSSKEMLFSRKLTCGKEILQWNSCQCLRKHKTILKSSFWKNSDKMFGKVIVEKITEEIAYI